MNGDLERRADNVTGRVANADESGNNKFRRLQNQMNRFPVQFRFHFQIDRTSRANIAIHRIATLDGTEREKTSIGSANVRRRRHGKRKRFLILIRTRQSTNRRSNSRILIDVIMRKSRRYRSLVSVLNNDINNRRRRLSLPSARRHVIVINARDRHRMNLLRFVINRPSNDQLIRRF